MLITICILRLDSMQKHNLMDQPQHANRTRCRANMTGLVKPHPDTSPAAACTLRTFAPATTLISHVPAANHWHNKAFDKYVEAAACTSPPTNHSKVTRHT